MSKTRPAIANDPTVQRVKMIGISFSRGTDSTFRSGRVSRSPSTSIATVAMNTIATTWKTNCGASTMISGPGRIPWMNIAASSTAAGADPGTASVSSGMIAPGTAALLPVSEAISPSGAPLPNCSRSGLARLAAA